MAKADYHDYYSKVTAKVSETGAGKVYVSKDNTTNSPDWKDNQHSATKETDNDDTHHYYLYAKGQYNNNDGKDYIFDYWEYNGQTTTDSINYHVYFNGGDNTEVERVYTAHFKSVEINTTPTSLTSLDFWQAPGYTHEQTFKVTATTIGKGNVDISSSNPEVFEVSPTSITAAQAKAGQVVTVTFKPTAANLNEPVQEGNAYKDGEFSATIDIKYNNHLYKQVNMTGKTYHYPVKVTDAKITTLYYDKPLVIPYDTYGNDINTVEYVSNLNPEDNTIDMTETYPIIPQETAVIIWTQKANTDLGFKFPLYNDYKNEKSPISGNYLKGSLVQTTPSAVLREAGASENAKVLTLGKRAGTNDQYGFYNYTGSTLAAYKAYLIYDPVPGAPSNISFSLGGGGGEYTAIQEAETVEAQAEDGAWYTLQGVRLNEKPNQRGLYLHNGKKIMVK